MVLELVEGSDGEILQAGVSGGRGDDGDGVVDRDSLLDTEACSMV